MLVVDPDRNSVTCEQIRLFCFLYRKKRNTSPKDTLENLHQINQDLIQNMSQNIYDQNEFFEKYIQLGRQVKGLDGAPEWPQIEKMLPDLKGLTILDLGCGLGWFARYAIERGATFVRAIDLSENMLKKARGMPNNGSIKYERGDLDELNLPKEEYDLVFSSLAFHYLANLPGLMQEIGKSLKPTGRLVYSVEHPIRTAPSNPSFLVHSKGDGKFWVLDDYQKEGPRVTHWVTEGVRKHHRTVETYINMLLKSGLKLTNLVEWAPTEEELKRFPERVDEYVRPSFLLVGATKT
ncbi:putative methyltransferase [Camillea tinctor]|nr:putative methyltransferase [Camillea tinctor]